MVKKKPILLLLLQLLSDSGGRQPYLYQGPKKMYKMLSRAIKKYNYL